jgi:dipicolinate synthase subunit A
MTVEIIGEGGRESACRRALLASAPFCNTRRIVLLPIPSSRNGVTVTGTDVALVNVLDGEGCIVAGYGLSSTFRAMAKERGFEIVDVSDDEEFTLENARLTAECTLSYIMNESSLSVSELKIGIVGYGRIGRVLTEQLLFHGADVTVFTRRESVRLELLFSGVDAALVADAVPSDLDYLINTAPAPMLTRSQCEKIGGTVLELASGDNLPWAKKLTRLPSLPAKMLPESSGRAYARAIVRAVDKKERCK